MPVYAVTPRRSMHYHPFAPVFGHNHCAPARASPALVPSLFRGIEEEFASMDSLFNNLVSRPAIRSFQPRFDVREEKDAFHLTGEVPGVEAGNIHIEFVDRNTLVVKGQTVKESKRGNPPTATEEQPSAQQDGKAKAVESAETQAATTEDVMETEPTSRPSTPASTSSNYHKATVEDSREDGDDFVDVAAESENTTAAAEPQQQAETSNTDNTVAAQTTTPEQKQAAKQEGHYWVSERSVGEFHRSFRFPGLVDQENVKASLKDGVLSVVVPKVKQSGPRTIRVE